SEGDLAEIDAFLVQRHAHRAPVTAVVNTNLIVTACPCETVEAEVPKAVRLRAHQQIVVLMELYRRALNTVTHLSAGAAHGAADEAVIGAGEIPVPDAGPGSELRLEHSQAFARGTLGHVGIARLDGLEDFRRTHPD